MTEDNALIERMRRGEQRAFDQFFEAYAARLGAFAARRGQLDAGAIEDVVQMTMINAIRGLAGFKGESSLFTWLCQICRNHLADARRKAARRPPVQSLEEFMTHTSGTVIELTDFRDPLEECASDGTRDAVRRAINELPPQYVRILELRFGDELKVAEIAALLRLSERAAESLLARARQAFKVVWTNAGHGGAPPPVPFGTGDIQ